MLIRSVPTGSARSSALLPLFFLLSLYPLAACGGGDDDPPGTTEQCLATLPTDCSPSIPVNFDSLYQNIFSQHCGTVGSSTFCHGSKGNQAGLTMVDIDTTYMDLVNPGTTRARVKVGDPLCSVLMERLESSDANYRMPKEAAQLAAGLRCAVQQWIEQGAKR